MIPYVLVGIVGGLAFVAHAAVNGSHLWPLVWPLLAGAVSPFFGNASGWRAGGWAGLAAGLTMFFGSMAAGMWITHSLMGAAPSPEQTRGAMLGAITGVSVAGAALAWLAGGLLGLAKHSTRSA